MLLNLLKRDLKLHWDSLVVPTLVLGMGLGALVLADEGVKLTGLILETSFLIPMLPLALHLRESTQGTLGDLLVLPVSRAAVVRLRYVEVLLFSAGMLALAHTGVWLALSVAARHPIPLGAMDRNQFLGVGILLIFWFAYPMPFFLRWGLKGLGFAYFPVVVYGTYLHISGVDSHRFIEGLMAHPIPMALGLSGLFALSYLLSLKAFVGRDF